jgi:hypothetical protein
MAKANYRKIWEEHNQACLLPNIHLHHIDGNRQNNDPSNLIPVTIEEHYEIHLKQGDFRACSILEKNWITGGHSKLRSIMGEEVYREWQRSHPLGKKRSPEQRKNHEEGAAKRLADPNFRSRLSEACKGKREIVTCPHCGVSGGGGNMRRYHFDKCKSKQISKV